MLGPTKSAERTAYDYLRDRILRGDIRGGTPIRQQDVADELNLSRIPIRDAIRHLCAEGLVKIEMNRRVVVTSLTFQDVKEIFLMRSVLEGLAARAAVTNFSDFVLQRLTFLVERMERLEHHTNEWLRCHEEFHGLICQQSNMPRLQQELDRLLMTVGPYLRIFVTTYGMAELKSSKHRALLTVFKKRDGDLAERAMREHVECALEEIWKLINRAKDTKGRKASGRPAKISGIQIAGGVRA